MEIVQELTTQYMPHVLVALVVVAAILVFAISFKSGGEKPAFHNLTTEDRKSAGKKRKLKEKKSTANGHVPTGDNKIEKSPKKSPVKEVVEPKQEKKEKKSEGKQPEKAKKNDNKTKNNVEEVKNKKNLKKSAAEKPLDFDDGDWEMVPTKSDKKKKGDQSPAKKEKKSNKKTDKVNKAEIEKLVKEVVNKELQENEKETFVEKEVTVEMKVEEVAPIEEPAVVIEEKKDKKKKEKKPKKEVTTDNKPSVPAEVKQEEAPKNVEEKPVVVAEENVKETKSDAKQVVAPVFDELGDTWTEAKTAKKSKKKARRDN